MAALWHSPRTYDRRLFRQHLQDDADFMYQHHRGIDERADRNQASHNGTHLTASSSCLKSSLLRSTARAKRLAILRTSKVDAFVSSAGAMIHDSTENGLR